MYSRDVEDNNDNDLNDNLDNRNEEFLDFDVKSGEKIEEQRSVLTQEQIIKQISNIDFITESYDDESVKALIEFNKNKIWNRVINENDNVRNNLIYR